MKTRRKKPDKQKEKQEKQDATLLAECALVRDVQCRSQRLDILQNSLLGIKPQHWDEPVNAERCVILHHGPRKWFWWRDADLYLITKPSRSIKSVFGFIEFFEHSLGLGDV